MPMSPTSARTTGSRALLCFIVVALCAPAALAQEAGNAAPQTPRQSPADDDAGQTFSDVPPEHPAHTSVEFLAGNGILKGYADGTFRPGSPVNRAEALKMIIAPHLTMEELLSAAQNPSPFADVAQTDWYQPYVAAAYLRGVIDGPPEKEKFHGSDRVRFAEFLKILQLSYGVDPVSDFGDVRLPLAPDVSDPDAWYYPYLRYALAASMATALADGTLKPWQELTRADAATLVFSLIAYREGIRIPVLLQIAQNEVQNVLTHLSLGDTSGARYASARSIVAARGAVAQSADAKVKGVMKLVESFAAIVETAAAGKEGLLKEAEAAAKTAWELAGNARAFSEDLDLASSLAQEIATNLAQEARAMMQQAAPPRP